MVFFVENIIFVFFQWFSAFLQIPLQSLEKSDIEIRKKIQYIS